MTIKMRALRTSALVALGLAATPAMGWMESANAAEVKPLGALDIQIGGKLRTWALMGDIKNKTGGNASDNYGSYDFRTDNEVYIYMRGKDEATGLEYGGNIELEADTNNSADADETYVFLRGKFGDIRFGDQNGITEQMVSGAQTLGVFTNGFDSERPFDAEALVWGAKSEDATKIAYYTPVFSGFQLGVSFTPSRNSNGNDIKNTQTASDLQDYLEPGIAYKGKFGDWGIIGSVTGGFARFDTNNSEGNGRQFYQMNSGINISFRNVTFGGGYGFTKGARPFGTGAGDTGTANSDQGYIGGFILEAGSRQQWFNSGVKAKFGPATVSLTYGQTLSSHVADGTPDGKDPMPHYGVAGVEVGVAPGLSVGGEVGYFNNSDGTANNDGVIGLAGMKLAF